MKFNRLLNIAIIISFCLTLFSCENNIQQINRITSKNSLPDLSVENVETFYSDSGIIKAKLIAPLVNQYNSEDKNFTEFPKGIIAISFDDSLKENANITANYAKYLPAKRVWEYRGDVKVKNPKGDILKTELLFADEKTEKLYTDQFVRIAFASGSQMQGSGFDSNLNFTKYNFSKPVGVWEMGNEK